MADIAAADVTYTLQEGTAELTGGSKYRAVFSVAFGDGTDTYPSGGVALTKAKLGCPTTIEALNFVEPNAADGFLYKYDASEEKVRIYQGDNAGTAASALVEFVGGTTAVPATTLLVEVTGW